MKVKGEGFTLIEIVAVVSVVALAAAAAVPGLAALQTEARIAKINGALRSVKTAADLARSIQLTHSLHASNPVVMAGQTINMVNGYPTAASIAAAARISGLEYNVDAPVPVAWVNQVTISADAAHPLCAVSYREAAPGTTPVYAVPLDPSNPTDREKCS